ncbi:unnamed protein product [Cladocopium goreaui]|uniref:Uncharacterized protein n=1 Tax=Cladocopium goreaui TaxID=2562237 RepID=A0A9P1G5H7_9DINO|nr:unnamed protein product [Cladocopium goreaui]
MDVAMYLQLLTFFVGWILEGPEIDISDKMDRCEASRETIRSVLSATGVHRITQVLAEAWQVFTAIKISGPNPACLVQSVPPPIAGAAPANEPGDLALVGMISHASILEEEAAVMLDWLDDIQSYAEGKRLPVVLNWIQDLRLVADPSIGVSDLTQCWESWMEDLGHSKVRTALKPPDGTSWKTSPEPAWLASVSERAGTKNIDTGKMSSQEFTEQVDEWVRIGLAQLRTLRMSQLARTRCFRKSSPEEQQKLEKLMGCLTEVDAEESLVSKEQVQAIVPVAQAQDEDPMRESSSSAKPAPIQVQLPLDPSEVFASVLNKEAGKAVPSPVRQQRVEAQGNQFNGFLSGLMTMGARGKDGDYDLLKACEKRMPLNEGFSSQLQRSNKEIKKLEEERNTLQMDEVAQPPEESQDQGAAMSDGSGEKNEIPEGFDPQASRALNRKRFTSRAWHAGMDQAIAQGLHGDEAKEKARRRLQKSLSAFGPTPSPRWQPRKRQARLPILGLASLL